MEFHIRHGTRRAADRLAVHAADKADQRLGGRKEAQDIRVLLGDLRPMDLDETGLIGSRL